jgi:hypothetical protein
MKEDNDKTALLLKEYELSWQGIEHHNTRLWSSASIFISGSLVALTFIGTRPLKLDQWSELIVVQTIAAAIIVIISLYSNIWRSLNLHDTIEFYRLEEIERILDLWRARYHTHMHELPVTLQEQIYTKEEVNKLTDAEKHILNRLQITKEQLSKYTCANKSFKRIIYIIIFCAIALSVRAWLIVLGYFPIS